MADRGLVALKRLYLVRHGSTAMTEAGRFNGTTDVPLSDRGRLQAESLSSELPDGEWAGVWCSELQRAVETARLAGYQAPRDGRLNEFDFGELEGRTWDDLDEATAKELLAFDGYQAPGGESVPHLRARLESFVAELAEGDHLVFTHGGVIRALLGGSQADRRVNPGDINVLEVD